MTDHIIKAAKAAGGATYTNRHHNGTACAFGPEALARFYALAYQAGMERAAEICDNGAQMLMHPSTGNFVAASLATTIRAHAQNQPESTHDTGNV